MFKTYFDHSQLFLLIGASVSFVLSAYFQSREKYKWAFLFLVITAAFVFSFAALLDPFLNVWDERFHAIVGKNLAAHPLMPTLYDDPVMNMAYDRWDRYHIWLHKQPLFLWQIALSFKIFGVSEFTLRLPMVVLATLLVAIAYRCGKLLVNERGGYFTGLLMITTTYIIEVVAGRQELEHNDLSFLFYVSASIWCLIEYSFSTNRRWFILIGIFSGCAVLCKWLPGLLVYGGWGMVILLRYPFRIKNFRDPALAFLITLVVVLPWQLLTYAWYPAEAHAAYLYNVDHFSVPLEGHGGPFSYHFQRFNLIYGAWASWLILPALAAFYFRSKDKKISAAIVVMALAVYLFFSFAATKMPSFTLMAAMLVLIIFASLIDAVIELSSQISRKKILVVVLSFLLALSITALRFDPEFYQEKHTLWKKENEYTRALIHNREVFLSLSLPSNAVICNVAGRHYVEAMFYTGLPAYGFIPSEEQYANLRAKGRVVAIFRDENPLPEYLANDESLILLEGKVVRFE